MDKLHSKCDADLVRLGQEVKRLRTVNAALVEACEAAQIALHRPMGAEFGPKGRDVAVPEMLRSTLAAAKGGAA